MLIVRGISWRGAYTVCKILLMGCLLGALVSCSGSSNTRSSSGAYYNTHSYDTYYRSGINRHHYNNYRRPRPVARPVRRR
jgi:hypothetical protein